MTKAWRGLLEASYAFGELDEAHTRGRFEARSDHPPTSPTSPVKP